MRNETTTKWARARHRTQKIKLHEKERDKSRRKKMEAFYYDFQRD